MYAVLNLLLSLLVVVLFCGLCTVVFRLLPEEEQPRCCQIEDEITLAEAA